MSRKTVNELCTNRRAITADTALMLATVFGNSADFWLNLQQRNEIWKALNTTRRRVTLVLNRLEFICIAILTGIANEEIVKA